MSEYVIRSVLILAGLACVTCEVWGSYDFMIEKRGHWDYLVAGSLVLTSLAAVLPLAAEYAHRQDMRGLKWAAWLAVPVALAFVFTVSIQRTGTATDTDEKSRQQIAETLKIAKAEQREAEDQLKTDKAAAARNCDVWGPVCTKAKAAQEATERKLAEARSVLKKQGVEVDDSMARRLVAYLPFLSKEQVQLYQPMLLPLGLAIVGSLLIAIGSRSRAPTPPSRDAAKTAGTSAGRPEAEEAKPAPPSTAAPKPVDAPQVTSAPPARPRLVVVNDEVPRMLTQLLDQTPGERVKFTDVCRAYVADCRAEGRKPLTTEEFAESARKFCKRLGIKTRTIKGAVYLLDVQLVASETQAHA